VITYRDGPAAAPHLSVSRKPASPRSSRAPLGETGNPADAIRLCPRREESAIPGLVDSMGMHLLSGMSDGTRDGSDCGDWGCHNVVKGIDVTNTYNMIHMDRGNV
jgi:hypothetical protein